MQFPVMFHVFGLTIHPHPVMEAAGYLTGFLLHHVLRRKFPAAAPSVPVEVRLWLLAAITTGALLGAKSLQFFEMLFVSPAPGTPSLESWLGGKTIVGGLIGAWIGTEIVKKIHGITRSTGDLWVFPLVAAIAIGRVGCFLTGLSDQTCGNFTSLPWAVDFGDGPRHPAQLYEIAFVLFWSIPCFFFARRWGFGTGRLFRFFMLGYMLFRFAVEFIKPSPKSYLGFSAIQFAAAATALYCLYSLAKQKKLPIHSLNPNRAHSSPLG